MKARKAFTALLAVVMTVSCFTGCGESTKKGEDKSNTNSTDAKTKSVMNEKGLPIVNEPVTLKIASPTGEGHKDKFEGMEMIARWEKETGVKMEFDTVPLVSWPTRKSLIFSSGDIPDMICANAGLTNDEVLTFADQEVIVPLEGYIAKYGENLNKILEENPNYKAGMITPDGKIYSYPALADIDFGYRGGVTYLNKKWLAEVGETMETVQGKYVEYVKNPITTEKFAEILGKFKKAYPNNYPFTTDTGSEAFLDYYASFGAVEYGNHLVVEDGKVSFSAVNPAIKDGIKWVNSLYTQGLIDPEVFSQDFATFIAKVQTEPYSVGAVKAWTIQQAFDMGDPRYKDWVILPPLTGPTGKTEWPEYVPGVSNGFAVITKQNKYPEVSARLMDYFYSEYNSVDLMVGPIGSAATDNGDGTYVQNPVPEGKTHNEWVASKNPGCMPFICPPELTNRISFNEAVDMTIEVGQVYRPYQVCKSLPGLMLAAEDKQFVADFTANALDLIKRKNAEWIQNGKIDAEWDAYVAELDKMGSKQYTEIYQKTYSAVTK